MDRNSPDLARAAAGAPTAHVPVLDVSVTPLSRDQLLDQIAQAITGGRRLTIAGHNLHSVFLTRTDPQFRRFYEDAELRLLDGMPLLSALDLAALCGGRPRWGSRHRLGSTDWIPQVVHLPGVRRIVLLGASAGSNARAARRLGDAAVGTELLGLPADPWDPDALDEVAARIEEFRPQLLLVGMGMPLQERVATALRARTAVPVIATVGGAIDQLSGAQSLAPRWVGRTGLEWAWRLASDPRRFAGRYLVEPFQLARLILRGAA